VNPCRRLSLSLSEGIKQLRRNMADHLSYSTLCDAAHKRKKLQASDWQHLHECDECVVGLAKILQVEIDLEELRKKFPAA
jgi:hypothetical protein